MTISVPSYVIPGTYLENAEFLVDTTEIGAIELLFFFYDDSTRALLKREFAGLRALRNRFRYSVHLPDVVLPAHEIIVEETIEIATHYIVHPPRTEDAPRLGTLLPQWIDRYGDRFLVENTRTELFEAAVAELPDIGICCDTGHLLLEGRSPEAFVARYGDRIRQFHLHGLADPSETNQHREQSDGSAKVREVLDHHPARSDSPWFRAIAPFLRSFDGIVELEVFSHAHVTEGLAQLRRSELIAPSSPSFAEGVQREQRR